MAAELRRRHLHRVAGARARLLEIERDALALRGRAAPAARTARGSRCRSSARQVADGEQMLHQLASRLTIVPTPWSVSSSISSEWCTRPSMMWAKPTPCSTASAQALQLGDHALADAVVLDPLAQLGGGQALDQACVSSVRVLEQAGHGGQIDDLLRLHRDRDRPRRLVGIDVVGLARRHWRRRSRSTGVSPSSSRRWISSARTSVTLPTKPSAGSRRRDGQQPGILARHADRDRLVAGLAVDRRDEVAVDLADQHHADDLERLRVGDAKAVAELRLLADAAQHRVDLRPAAVDQHAAHADAAQQQHVLRQREVGLACRSPRRRASPRPTCRRTGGCRAAPRRGRARFRRSDDRHDVLLFSLM